MKVALLNTIYKKRSTGRICSDFIAYTKTLNDVEAFMYFGFGGVSDEDSFRLDTDREAWNHLYLTRLFDSHAHHSKKATKKLILKLKEYKPDVLFIHNMHGYYLDMEMFLSYVKESNIPTIFVLHDCWLFTGHCAYFDVSGCNKWKTHCKHCPSLKEYPRSILIDRSKHNFDWKVNCFKGLKNVTFVGPCKWIVDLFKESHLKDYPVRVINNGIETSVFKHVESDFRKKHNLEGKKLILGIAYEWEERKGLKDLLELEKALGENERLIIIGKLKDKVSFSDKVIYIERTNDTKELAEIYSSCDVMFNPTYEDNYPTTILEALACHLPVITYDTGGCGEQVDKRYLINKGDIKTAIKLIKEEEYLKDYVFPDISKLDKKTSFDEYIKLMKEMKSK